MPRYQLTLFITGNTPASDLAKANLAAICRDYLRQKCRLSIIDVIEHPDQAEHYKVMATPTLIKSIPAPMRRIIGDLSNKPQVLMALGLTGPTGEPTLPLEDAHG